LASKKERSGPRTSRNMDEYDEGDAIELFIQGGGGDEGDESDESDEGLLPGARLGRGTGRGSARS
jgi:hypothetical protein